LSDNKVRLEQLKNLK
jgi:Leucine-rich repeat (LRR) protein